MKRLCLWLVVPLLFSARAYSQRASVSETRMIMPTYMFSDPDPVPRPGKIYPYFRFEGYSAKSELRDWNMVVLENDHIRVMVCPEIGGKVWAAVEKSTGGEFLYYNKVVKFRDVAMRGPWTSGGLEFNFGDIGHAPTCSTPVDYTIEEHEDGSVSCTVGAMDLVSRTRWNVEIRLPANAAYFETRARWFNTTQLPTSYYHWMNAAAKASGNLEIIAPGTAYIGHGGEPGQWPVENGRNLAFYENNNFGSYKSYHIVNGLAGFFGGYWHDENFGYGHLAQYDEKPGKKIWIWGLSRQGMIWEGLLTDSDGQYIEYQSGKLLNQASEPSTFTPFKHREFHAHDSEVMRELWFPLLGTGGMVAVSEYAVLNVTREKGSARLIISALQPLREKLIVRTDAERIEINIDLKTLELYTTEFRIRDGQDFSVEVGDRKLFYRSQDTGYALDRPVEPNQEFDWNSAYGLYTAGLELERQRMYERAYDHYMRCLHIEPAFLPALGRVALAEYRRLNDENCRDFALKALAVDTYDPLANYVYGLVSMRQGRIREARSGFSLAAQAPGFRSAAFTELSVIALREKDFKVAGDYAGKAIAANAWNLAAHEVAALVHRATDQSAEYESRLSLLKEIDPNSHFVRYEKMQSDLLTADEFLSGIRTELPGEVLIELALTYLRYGFTREAMAIFDLAPNNPVALLLRAYHSPDGGDEWMEKALSMPVGGVFPHRHETCLMLEDGIRKNGNWKLKYYLALVHWNMGNLPRAQDLFAQCSDEPDYAPFYLARAQLMHSDSAMAAHALDRAFFLAPEDWRVGLARINACLDEKDYTGALETAFQIHRKYPENILLGLKYAEALIGAGRHRNAVSFLEKFNTLPAEGATAGRMLYREAALRAALDAWDKRKYKEVLAYVRKAKLWPENLGAGRPYEVDERMENYVLYRAYTRLGQTQLADEYARAVMDHITSADQVQKSAVAFQVATLVQHGRQPEAVQLIEDALQLDPENQFLAWIGRVLAFGVPERLDLEITDHFPSEDLRDALAWDPDFGLLKDVLNKLP
jgi:tetratricopeptide (TPR) repeat protein